MHLVVQNGDMRFLLLEFTLADALPDISPFLLLEVILANRLADLPHSTGI